VCAKILAPLAIFSIFFAPPSICRASPVTSEKEEFAELQEQVRELVQQLSEMRREHAAEIEALNEKIAELRRATAPGARPEQAAVEVDDLEALRRAAESEASKEVKAEELPEEKVFSFGSLGLQALNPEISITGDLLGSYRSGDDVTNQWDWDFRALGIHFETYLDPYSRLKASVPGGVVLAAAPSSLTPLSPAGCLATSIRAFLCFPAGPRRCRQRRQPWHREQR
jgi:septal ring factor EnvC (AmiA/AmiB activator)